LPNSITLVCEKWMCSPHCAFVLTFYRFPFSSTFTHANTDRSRKKNVANYDHIARQFKRKFNDCSIQHFRGLLILRYIRKE